MIYFISNGHSIKIGSTLDSANTLKTLQEGSHMLLSLVHSIDAGIEYETMLHKYFSKYLLLGSWYMLPTDYKAMADNVEELLEGFQYELPLHSPFNPNVVADHTFTKAMVIEHLTMVIPRDNKAKLNVSGLSRVLPLSVSSAQRAIKELVEEDKFLIKHSRSEYSFAELFYVTYPEYKTKFVL